MCTHKKENGKGLDIVSFKKQVAGVNSLRVYTLVPLYLYFFSRDARSDLAAADKRVADADKRLADADKRLADARHDLAAARHDLAVAEAQKERDEDDIKQCKQDIKQCKEYVKQYRQHVATTLKLLNAAQEAALELYPCKFISCSCMEEHNSLQQNNNS